MLVAAVAWVDQLDQLVGVTLEQKAEEVAHAVQALAAVDVKALSPEAAGIIRTLRGELE